MNWQPTASLENLKIRATILSELRQFFAERNILEVETPCLSQHTVTDINIASFSTDYCLGSERKTFFLQTSPEYAMKRLLAAGSGPIYQITKAFRNGESGSLHNSEFTMLEWYRPEFSHHELMNEMDDLLKRILKCGSAERMTYQELFEHYFKINPHTIESTDLKKLLKNYVHLTEKELTHIERDTVLQLLMTHCIEPNLGKTRPLFLLDFPASQAALAKIRPGNPPVAERFEVYIHGMELANGFHELLDASEQLKRFKNDQAERVKRHLPNIAIDSRFIAALEHGLPNCAGVALGVDRLVMVALNTQKIADVIGFPSTIA